MCIFRCEYFQRLTNQHLKETILLSGGRTIRQINKAPIVLVEGRPIAICLKTLYNRTNMSSQCLQQKEHPDKATFSPYAHISHRPRIPRIATNCTF